MPGSVGSLSSSASVASEDAAPVQLDTSNKPRRQLVLRRLSSATGDFLLINPDRSDSTINRQIAETVAEENEVLGLESDDDLFGANLIHHLMSRRSRDVESLLTADMETPQMYMGPTSSLSSAEGPTSTGEPLRRRRSTVVATIQTITKKMGFWDLEFHAERIRIIVTLASNYIFLIAGFMISLCIYWGAYYDRTSKYKDIKFAVMIADEQVGSLSPILGKIVSTFFQNAAVAPYGNFEVWNSTRLALVASSHNNTLTEEVYRQVHHQKYKAAFYVHPNATFQMYEALVTLNSTFEPSQELLSAVYETGSDYNAIFNYVSTLVLLLCVSFGTAMMSAGWTQDWMSVLNSTQIEAVLTEAPKLLTSLPEFQANDRIPVPEAVVQAPLQIGLIYLCVFTFFQFIFSLPIQMYVASKIKGWKFVVFRIATAQSAYFQLSLAYVVLNTAFQIPFNKAFGYLGFLVIWGAAFLTMSSVGSMIEILVLACIVLKPAMIGVMLLLVAVTNLAPTISPIFLCPTFYRYGYAMPVYNSYHIMQVALFDSWKGNLGRHFGILVAWIIVTNACMPFMMKWVSKQMQKQKAAAAAAAAK